ncbi:MAG: inorganic phosphate transporter [Methanomicrobiales archaeon]|nr:inorganic phosphate transporter [Methanomicrobiales archaeon]
METLIISGIILAFLFNFLTGMNDAANSIATVVATSALPPRRAILLAALANFAGPFLFSTAVAGTFATGIVRGENLTLPLFMAGLTAAVSLVLIATLTGFPISSSNALSGGLIGAAIAEGGAAALLLPDSQLLVRCAAITLVGSICGGTTGAILSRSTRLPLALGIASGSLFGLSLSITSAMVLGILHISGILAILLFIFIAPTIGFAFAFLFDVLISHLFRRSRIKTRRRVFQPLHLLAAAIQGAGHGAHDGQHAMGIIVGLLLASGSLESFSVPTWVLVASAIAMGTGTCFGGWRVIERLARKITQIRPYQGFSAAASGGVLLSAMTMMGIPVSSTHVISGTIVGVGVTRGREAVQWSSVRSILAAWLITIPASLALSWSLAGVFHLLAG